MAAIEPAFGDFTGFLASKNEVRYINDPTTGRPMAHVYEFLSSMGMNYDASRKALKPFLDDNNLRKKIPKLRFASKTGSTHNQASWAADAETLYQIVMTLNRKYRKELTEFAAKCATLTLGGSKALRGAIEEMEGVQQTLPESHPMRVMGREAEYVDAKYIRPASESIADPSYCAKRVGAADYYHTLFEAVNANNIKNDVQFWIYVHSNISKAVLGNTPAAFTREHEITGARSGRDYMIKAQISGVETLEANLANVAHEYKDTDGKEFLIEVKRMCDLMYQMSQRATHGKYQQPTRLPEVREAHKQHVLQLLGAHTVNIQNATVNNYITQT